MPATEPERPPLRASGGTDMAPNQNSTIQWPHRERPGVGGQVAWLGGLGSSGLGPTWRWPLAQYVFFQTQRRACGR